MHRRWLWYYHSIGLHIICVRSILINEILIKTCLTICSFCWYCAVNLLCSALLFLFLLLLCFFFDFGFWVSIGNRKFNKGETFMFTRCLRYRESFICFSHLFPVYNCNKSTHRERNRESRHKTNKTEPHRTLIYCRVLFFLLLLLRGILLLFMWMCRCVCVCVCLFAFWFQSNFFFFPSIYCSFMIQKKTIVFIVPFST